MKMRNPKVPPPLECEHQCSTCHQRIIDGKWSCWCREYCVSLLVMLLVGGLTVVVWCVIK